MVSLQRGDDPARNYLRASARNYLRALAATGQTQQPFLGRWLLLTAAMFDGSTVTCFGPPSRADEVDAFAG